MDGQSLFSKFYWLISLSHCSFLFSNYKRHAWFLPLSWQKVAAVEAGDSYFIFTGQLEKIIYILSYLFFLLYRRTVFDPFYL